MKKWTEKTHDQMMNPVEIPEAISNLGNEVMAHIIYFYSDEKIFRFKIYNTSGQ